MGRWVSYYFLFELAIVVLAILTTMWFRARRRRARLKEPPKGFVLTDESFIDPTTGVKQRVWYNPNTGERYYETWEDE
ncbi:hypothetical protein GCM10025857_32390 [Alicyclobacillus contaminans]|uniref:hypothetical protein n=1 Tax=Alicyclobacillus contaminans TaxID=392016 RepID=UPI0003FD28E2|nr:hypothetical protein [Alicyclobacillus contaminans]GMA51882.1 hypothetical protein GCM10025857_32390 [Alicyclobacillus contaminans]